MTTYVTMTAGGMYGRSFPAADDDAAAAEAERRGYQVLDIIDSPDAGEAIIVVA
jgi:hypothetical protein